MVSLDPKQRERVQAEAAAWLARLNNDERAPEADAAFQEWLQAAPEHAAAFERVSAVWDLLPDAASLERAANDRPARRTWMWGAVAAAAVVLAIAGGNAWMTRPVTYQTGHGQQQTVTLRDGSQLALNTDSEVTVAFAGGKRRMDLMRGEVLFDVAHDPKSPFIVSAGNERVQALGTAFVVRRDPDRTRVTLLRGRVGVSRVTNGGEQSQAILSPGERASVDSAEHVTLDRPSIEAVTAWQRGEVVFAGTSLGEAAAELNRYGSVRIVITDPAVAALRVSGIFATDNAPEFADAMAQLNGLKVRRSKDVVELVR